LESSTSEAKLNVGEELNLSVYALAYGGEGIAKHSGIVVFLPEALPGDTVRARLVQVKQKFARAEIVEVVKPSADRIEPFCPQSGACGGCTWQHLAYPAQLEAKRLFVENTLLHLGRLKQVLVPPTLKAMPQTGYRHKIQIPLQTGPEGLRCGFYAKQTHDVVPVHECPIQPALGNRIFRAVSELAQEYGYAGYNEHEHCGQLRHLVMRLTLASREALAVLVTAVPELPRLAEFAAELRRRVPELAGVLQNINADKTNVILGREFRLLAGRNHIYETVRGFRYRISAESFFQVNPYQLPALADAVVQAAGCAGRETVVDLYCGVGTLTLELAGRARLTIGVESARSAIEDARANVLLNNLTGVEFLLADVQEGVRQLQAKGFKPDVVVLDPPRKGCEPPLLDKLVAWRPKRIVYVSCNPVTLARDLARLVRGPYRVQSVQPIDMFPHTYHVESVATLAVR
jgi:23S rRNA (uracil1939-C5)-methyltransferase